MGPNAGALTLSKAMYRGAKSTKKAVGAYFNTDDNGKVCDACAIGAALCVCANTYSMSDLSYIRSISSTERFIAERTGVDMLKVVLNPANGMKQEIWQAIMSLNDFHGWRRERIAAWLRTQGL